MVYRQRKILLKASKASIIKRNMEFLKEFFDKKQISKFFMFVKYRVSRISCKIDKNSHHFYPGQIEINFVSFNLHRAM